MDVIHVQVQPDHLDTLARTKPMAAMAELVWNALDAEATQVRVSFEENQLGGVEAVRIADNGHGLHRDDAARVFSNLGGSWKRSGQQSLVRRRVLHGQYGKGRFRAFSLGQRAVWDTVYEADGEHRRYWITGDAAQPSRFLLSPAAPADDMACGMTVTIENPYTAVDLLRGVKATEELTAIFAPYLRQYPDVTIIYDNVPIDPANAELHVTEYDLGELVMQEGERAATHLTVVEWRQPGRRGVYLCDAEGFARHAALPRLHFRGFSYTAYLKSPHLAALDRQGLLQMEELASDVQVMLDSARTKLREHFALREAEIASDIIARWQAQGIYPYEGEPASQDEDSERRIFDIYATHLAHVLPDLLESGPRRQALVLRLVRELVHADPTRLARVFDEVVSFPEDKQDEVMELLGA